jgi:flagellar biogenesis protein FliO
MSARWVARIMALILILAFFFLFAHLQKRLIELQQRGPGPATTSTR